MTNKLYYIVIMFCVALSANAQNGQSELSAIEETLNHYIEGTSQGQPSRLNVAFHPDFNLYSVNENNELKVWDGADYISRFEEGKKNSRVGKIISIDFENDAAMAKVEIAIPGYKLFTDYFLLLKLKGQWKIIHKTYTSKSYPIKKE